jgi:shikimate dehydrogenase
MNEINCQSALICNFGQPVWENPTEYMMEAVFKHHDLKMRYITTEVSKENLKAAFQGVKAMGFKGFNCTLPHKKAIIPYLDGLGKSAKLIGAVNCVVERQGKYIGENTDGKGFIISISKRTDLNDKKVVLFGAGGAASAIAIELALAGVKEIIIVNRNADRARELSNHIQSNTSCSSIFQELKDNYIIPSDSDIIINATSIGLYPNIEQRVPVDSSTFKSNMIVCDVIINPPQTRFLDEANAKGCQTLNGLGMVVNQAVLAVEYWSGVKVDSNIMTQTLLDLFDLNSRKQAI